MIHCDVIIVNFNAGSFLKDAVQSALQSPAVAHVYVVDNASCDTSLAALPRHENRLTIIRNGTNLGFAVACNIGLARTTSQNVLLLNPDCRVAEGAIENLIRVLRSNDRNGMVGPHLLNPDGSEQAGGRRKFPMPRLVLGRALGSTWLRWYVPFSSFLMHQDPLPPEPIEVEAISGACMMVRNEAVAAVGPFDEGYFLHCEDLDWSMRFHQKGWKILFVPEAKVFHIKGVSSRYRPLAAEYYKHRGMVRFYRKFLTEFYPRWLTALLIVAVWFRFIAVAVWRLLR